MHAFLVFSISFQLTMTVNILPDLFHAAAPEGDNLQLGFIEGLAGENYNARILANEIEFNAAGGVW